MTTTPLVDHAVAGEMARTVKVTDMSRRPLYQMRGTDRCGRTDLAVGHEEAAAAFAAAEQTEETVR